MRRGGVEDGGHSGGHMDGVLEGVERRLKKVNTEAFGRGTT